MGVSRKRSTLTDKQIFKLRKKNLDISHSQFALKAKISIVRYYRCLIQQDDLTAGQLLAIDKAVWSNRTEFSRLFPLFHPEISGVVFKSSPHKGTEECIYKNCNRVMDRVGITAEEISETYNAMKFRKSLNLGYPNDILEVNH